MIDKSLKSYSNNYDTSRFDNYEHHIDMLLRLIYKHMIDRCYNKLSTRYQAYGNIGITVCEKWLNDINAFINDVKQIDGFDKYYCRPYLYEFDKDYKQMLIPKCHRIYSKETCMFLYYQDNINLKCIDHMKEFGNGSGYYGIEINSAGNYYARIKIKGTRVDYPIVQTKDNDYYLKHSFDKSENKFGWIFI